MIGTPCESTAISAPKSDKTKKTSSGCSCEFVPQWVPQLHKVEKVEFGWPLENALLTFRHILLQASIHWGQTDIELRLLHLLIQLLRVTMNSWYVGYIPGCISRVKSLQYVVFWHSYVIRTIWSARCWSLHCNDRLSLRLLLLNGFLLNCGLLWQPYLKNVLFSLYVVASIQKKWRIEEKLHVPFSYCFNFWDWATNQ